MAGFLGVHTLVLQGLLRGEAHGAELVARIEALTQGHTKLRVGRLYSVLRSLEARGLLRSRIGEPLPMRAGRPRVHYALTAVGKKAARADRDRAAAVFGLIPEDDAG